MTYSELSSWCPLELSEGDKVIFTVCGESKVYDRNNSGLLGRAIHLKPQNLSVDWSGSVCVFISFVYCVYVGGFVCLLVCLSVYVLCDCVMVLLCLCETTDASKNMTKSTQPFILAPSTWSFKIFHITTAGSANNGRHYRVVWPIPEEKILSHLMCHMSPTPTATDPPLADSPTMQYAPRFQFFIETQ